MATTILIHNNFLSGNLDTQFATDLAMLSPAHRAALDQWISDLLSGNDHEGRNKESWLDGQTNFLHGSDAYKNANAWHYHCGPYETYPGTKRTPAHLPRNMQGRCTHESIHYFKNALGVAVFGFSKEHVPFLNSRNLPVGVAHPFAKTLATKFNNVRLPAAIAAAIINANVPPATPDPENEDS